MKQYRITSDRLMLGEKGDVVNEDALDGVNIDALVSGGHLELVKAAATTTNKNQEEK